MGPRLTRSMPKRYVLVDARTIRVENGDKQRVDRADARVDPSDRHLLKVGVPSLPSGKYRVFWSVVARDGHRTEGDFPFRIR